MRSTLRLGALRSYIVGFGLVFGLVSWAQPEPVPVNARELTHAMQTHMTEVLEFQFIREQAERLGVRVWLFGGTAAGYAHYVKWDLQRQKGDIRFQPDRFDYDYTNIFRSTQDADIVMDGTAEQAAELQRALAGKFPHLMGNKGTQGKSPWEVRLLKESMGNKEALLNNKNFLNQHSDSHSTGLIEVTIPEGGESLVKDLRDWKSKEPFFLKDVVEGKLHYYYSKDHFGTARAKNGLNPEILSVIRYLTKAVQYELRLRPEDLKLIKQIIDALKPSDLRTEYVRNWIENNAKKIIQNAVNIEYAVNLLDELGLRKKLINMGDRNIKETLSWWMNKKPLSSLELGRGHGQTASEFARSLGIKGDLIIGHETRDFLAYESITRAHTGDANFLESRSGYEGESAAFGNGVYGKLGKYGAKNTGWTIRYVLNPKARIGSDFTYDDSHQFFVIKNKKAIRIIPEKITLSVSEYFKIILEGKEIDPSERAMLEMFKRRAGRSLLAIDDDQREFISAELKRIREKISKTKLLENEEAFLNELVTFNFAKEWIDQLYEIYRYADLDRFTRTRLLETRLAGDFEIRLRNELGLKKPLTTADGFLEALAKAAKNHNDYLLEILSVFLIKQEARKLSETLGASGLSDHKDTRRHLVEMFNALPVKVFLEFSGQVLFLDINREIFPLVIEQVQKNPHITESVALELFDGLFSKQDYNQGEVVFYMELAKRYPEALTNSIRNKNEYYETNLIWERMNKNGFLGNGEMPGYWNVVRRLLFHPKTHELLNHNQEVYNFIFEYLQRDILLTPYFEKCCKSRIVGMFGEMMSREGLSPSQIAYVLSVPEYKKEFYQNLSVKNAKRYFLQFKSSNALAQCPECLAKVFRALDILSVSDPSGYESVIGSLFIAARDPAWIGNEVFMNGLVSSMTFSRKEIADLLEIDGWKKHTLYPIWKAALKKGKLMRKPYLDYQLEHQNKKPSRLRCLGYTLKSLILP